MRMLITLDFKMDYYVIWNREVIFQEEGLPESASLPAQCLFRWILLWGIGPRVQLFAKAQTVQDQKGGR